MTIADDDVLHVARLARIALGPDEVARAAVDLTAILDAAAALTRLDTTGVAPTAHPLPLANVLRDDDVAPPLARDAFLSQAPASEDGYVRVPRILDSGSGAG
jgi:aspartyl-tRNA(Asn)/glutamyl-tRNA(Gln) amidotransferase subunit C